MLFVAFTTTASAQDSAALQEQLQAWENTAAEAQAALEEERPSIEVLERLRATLSEQRDAAFDLGREGSIEARTLQAQLDALGPPPEEGEAEAEDVAARRSELNEQLSAANAPLIQAEETYERAQLLISEIDRQIRANQAARLLQRLPAPILPTNWQDTPGELWSRTRDFSSDLSSAFGARAADGTLQSTLPTAIAMVSFGLVLILIIAPWVSQRALAMMRAGGSGARRGVVALVTFFVRMLVPALGLLLVFAAPLVLGLQMPRGQAIINVLPTLLGFIVAAHILGYALFRNADRSNRIFEVDDEFARKGYRLTLLLGLFLAVEKLLQISGAAYRFTPETRSLLGFIVLLGGAVPLWRLSTLLVHINDSEKTDAASSTDQAGPAPTFTADIRWLVARLIQISVILAIGSSALGYVNFARQAMVPMVITAGTLAAAVYFQALLRNLVQAALGQTTEDEAEGAFILSALVSLLVILATVPILALIWGARATDILEVWRILTDGVEFGDTRISLTTLLTFAVVVALGLAITRWVQRLLKLTLLPRTKIDRGARSSIVTGMGYVGLTLTLLIGLSSAGINLSSLAVVFGALSVGIGFGLQNIVSNFVSGIILLVERPVQEGDWIEVSGQSGIVKKIAVRSTRIETFDRFDVIIPNSDLIAGTVKNMTLFNQDGRLILPVGVAYGSDVTKVKEILEGVAKDDDRIMTFPAPTVLFVGLGDSSLNFELRLFLKDIGTILAVKSDLLFRTYAALNDAGIEIPFPQRDVNLKGLERLARAIEEAGGRERST